MDEKFQLKTPDPPKRQARYQSDPARQGVLFAGSFSTTALVNKNRCF